MKQVETQLARLREQQTELARSINKKVKKFIMIIIMINVVIEIGDVNV